MLEERRCYAESIMESKSKEMRQLITGFEEAEDHRAPLLMECGANDEVMNKFIKKRKKLEEFINSQINKYKSETLQLEAEVRDLKMKQLKPKEGEVFFPLMKMRPLVL